MLRYTITSKNATHNTNSFWTEEVWHIYSESENKQLAINRLACQRQNMSINNKRRWNVRYFHIIFRKRKNALRTPIFIYIQLKEHYMEPYTEIGIIIIVFRIKPCVTETQVLLFHIFICNICCVLLHKYKM